MQKFEIGQQVKVTNFPSRVGKIIALAAPFAGQAAYTIEYPTRELGTEKPRTGTTTYLADNLEAV
jgi:hypothetical protein